LSTKPKDEKKVINLRTPEYEDAVQAARLALLKCNDSIAAIAASKPFQEMVKRQADMFEKIAEMAKSIALPSVAINELRGLEAAFTHIDLPRDLTAVPQVVQSVNEKLLRYISSLEKELERNSKELSIKDQKIRELLERLESFKKRLKEKPDYIK